MRHPDLPDQTTPCDAPRSAPDDRFWERLTLDGLTPEQWESLCDGCGKCCLEKFEDEDSDRIVYSRVACRLLDLGSCRCQDYEHRAREVPDCITLTREAVRDARWLPETCAYRRLAEGRPIPHWHPLISGDPQSVVRAGHSMRGRAIPPGPGCDPILHLIDWVW